jgi:energy-coupling factor transport system ATP-binding protein
LRREGRHTLVIVEHRLDDLMPLVDQVVVLDQSGALLADGPPRRVLRDWARALLGAGVWVPQVSELASALEAQGVALEPFPVTVGEAVSALAPLSVERRPEVLSREASESESETVFASARDLSFRYPRGDRPAVADVSLEVRSGEIAVVVGANGAGKSTLARLFVGILPAPPGHVFVRGADVTRFSRAELARQIGYVFQYPEHQFVGRSVLDDVAFGLRRAGRSTAEADRVAHALLEEFGLDRLAAAHPYALSHGEQRRLSVAAMLALGQHALFLDEPTFGQDRRNAYLLFDKLRELARAGHAIVTISHDMRLVAELAARVVVLAGGRVVFDGPPADLFGSSVPRQAGLREPPITQLGRRLGLSAPVLSVGDFLGLVRPLEVGLR